MGLKPEVVQQAKTQVGEATDEVNQVIAGLEAQRRRQETKAAEAQSLLQQAKRLYKQVSAKAASLEHHPRVNNYEPAEQADRGSGVTVAYIKK